MADTYTFLRMKENDDVFSPYFVPASGTITLSSVLCYLYDANRVVNAAVNGVAATAFDTGALAQARAWLQISPATLVLTAETYYTLEFKATDSGGLVREAIVLIHVTN